MKKVQKFGFKRLVKTTLQQNRRKSALRNACIIVIFISKSSRTLQPTWLHELHGLSVSVARGGHVATGPRDQPRI
jgi:pyruvate/2-oxoacid:ferredoxin oxidoreductase beta subunit